MLTQRDIDMEQRGSMPPTKIEAFFNQFPWAKKFVHGSLSCVYVMIMEPIFLVYSPGEYVNFAFLFFFEIFQERLILVDKEGAQVIAETKIPKKKFWFFGPTVMREKKIVGLVNRKCRLYDTALALGEKADNVYFAISYYDFTETAIIYKVPGKLSLGQWIREEKEKEKKLFKRII